MLDIPPLGCVNLHASLLPALRGSGPVQWAILNGLDETGVTAMYMAAEMDAGDIIATRKTAIDPLETSGQLLERLAELGAPLLSETVRAIADGTVTRTPQDPGQVTFAPMLTKDRAPIDWSRTDRQTGWPTPTRPPQRRPARCWPSTRAGWTWPAAAGGW